jgi:hypothetical protein
MAEEKDEAPVLYNLVDVFEYLPFNEEYSNLQLAHAVSCRQLRSNIGVEAYRRYASEWARVSPWFFFGDEIANLSDDNADQLDAERKDISLRYLAFMSAIKPDFKAKLLEQAQAAFATVVTLPANTSSIATLAAALDERPDLVALLAMSLLSFGTLLVL